MRILTAAIMLGRTTSIPLTTALVLLPAAAQQGGATMPFDIAPGSLQAALMAYAAQAKIQLIYAPEIARARKVSGLKGILSADAALVRLLAGTGIRIRHVDKGVIMLETPGGSGRISGSGEPGITLSRDGAVPPPGAPSLQSAPADDQIVVTGSHIRGAPPSGSPVRTISRKDIERNGYGSLAQALGALPSNFGGMATEQSALSAADRSGSNATLASGINLRGLGPEATLVLVNGRRIAGAGLLGDFADISSIPLAALDRVEIVTDGASAIYGSDAVAGIVNIILKDRFEGFESNVRLGSVTQGSAREIQVSQVAGHSWSSGSVLVAYEFQRRSGLKSKDRAYARSADSRPFGGTDHRYPFSLPGNVFDFDPPTGGFGPVYAIPAGQDGKALQAADFVVGNPNLENFRTGTDLTPDQTRHSLYAHATQQLTDRVTFSIEGRFAQRRFDSQVSGYATILGVTAENPWFVSPTGSESDLIGYAFTRELGATRSTGSAQSAGITAALDIDLGASWKLRTYGAYARQRDRSRTDRIANEYLLAEALGSIPDDPATPYDPAVTGYFNPYGDGGANSPAVLRAIGGYYANTTRSTISTGDIQADGPLFTLPGGLVRLAVGGNYRHETFASRSSEYVFTPSPQAGTPADYGRSIWAGFAELSLPIFGPGNARPGLESLELSAAVRTEHYGDFGTTSNPKLALRWVPLEGLAVRGSWGTSFRAPNLRELQQPGAVNTAILQRTDGSSAIVIQQSGGNPDLSPERARSWTAGIDIAPRMLPGFTTNITLFRTIFDRRIDLPGLRNFSRALVDPTLAAFVRFVSPASDAADRAYVNTLLASASAGTSYPAETIAAVVDTRYVNTGKIDVAGADFDLAYAFDGGSHRFSFGLTASYLQHWREQLTPSAPAIDRRNAPGRPVDWRGRLTGGWTHGSFDVLIGLNHVNPYRDLDGARITAWNTVDLRVSYTIPARSGWLSGGSIALAAQNLFDRAPPFYDSTAGAGYDGANADATGRFVSLQIAKHW